MSGTVEDRIKEIVAEQAVLEPSDITLDQSLDDLGIDSMGVVEAIFSIEESFDIHVPFNANEPEKSEFDISSVQSIVTAVESLIAEQKG